MEDDRPDGLNLYGELSSTLSASSTVPRIPSSPTPPFPPFPPPPYPLPWGLILLPHPNGSTCSSHRVFDACSVQVNARNQQCVTRFSPLFFRILKHFSKTAWFLPRNIVNRKSRNFHSAVCKAGQRQNLRFSVLKMYSKSFHAEFIRL